MSLPQNSLLLLTGPCPRVRGALKARTFRFKQEAESATKSLVLGSLFSGKAGSRPQAGVQGGKTQGNEGTMSA